MTYYNKDQPSAANSIVLREYDGLGGGTDTLARMGIQPGKPARTYAWTLAGCSAADYWNDLGTIRMRLIENKIYARMGTALYNVAANSAIHLIVAGWAL